MRLRGLSSFASSSRKTSVVMMNEPTGIIFPCKAGVARPVYPLVPTKTSRARSQCGLAQTCDIPCGVQSGADFIDHAAVVNGRSNLRLQFVTRDHPQLVVEFARDQFSLPCVVVKMLLLAGYFEVATPREIAIDGFFADNPFHTIDGCQRCSIHPFGQLPSISGDELVHPKLQPGQHHAAIARTGAPANRFTFEHSYVCAALGQRAGGGKA